MSGSPSASAQLSLLFPKTHVTHGSWLGVTGTAKTIELCCAALGRPVGVASRRGLSNPLPFTREPNPLRAECGPACPAPPAPIRLDGTRQSSQPRQWQPPDDPVQLSPTFP